MNLCPRCATVMRYDPDPRDAGPFCLSCGYRPRTVIAADALEPLPERGAHHTSLRHSPEALRAYNSEAQRRSRARRQPMEAIS